MEISWFWVDIYPIEDPSFHLLNWLVPDGRVWGGVPVQGVGRGSRKYRAENAHRICNFKECFLFSWISLAIVLSRGHHLTSIKGMMPGREQGKGSAPPHPLLWPFRHLKCTHAFGLRPYGWNHFVWILHVKSILCPLGKEQSSGAVAAYYAQMHARNTWHVACAWIIARHVQRCPVCVQGKPCSGLKIFIVTHVSPFK